MAAERNYDDTVFMRALKGLPAAHTPIWLMRQAGRYMPEYRAVREKVSILELCKTPELAAKVTLDAARILGTDAAIIFADILLLLEPMGVGVKFVKGVGPRIEQPIRSAGKIEDLASYPVREELSFVYEALSLTRRELPPDVALIGFSGAPFTLAAYLIEGGGSRRFETARTFMYSEPAAWDRLLAHLADHVADHLLAQIDAGAQAVQLFDSWVGCLSPSTYRARVAPHVKRIARRLEGRAPLIHFGLGTAALLTEMREAAGDVMGVDYLTDLDTARTALGGTPVQGNLDPAVLLAPVSRLEEAARDVLRRAAGRPGHVFNLGHGVLPETPVDNVKRLVDLVHEETSRKVEDLRSQVSGLSS